MRDHRIHFQREFVFVGHGGAANTVDADQFNIQRGTDQFDNDILRPRIGQWDQHFDPVARMTDIHPFVRQRFLDQAIEAAQRPKHATQREAQGAGVLVPLRGVLGQTRSTSSMIRGETSGANAVSSDDCSRS